MIIPGFFAYLHYQSLFSLKYGRKMKIHEIQIQHLCLVFPAKLFSQELGICTFYEKLPA